MPHQQGITIIEVVISISILAVGVAGIAAAFPNGIRYTYAIQHETVAYDLARETAALYLLIPYDSLTLGATIDTVAAAGVSFTRTITIEQVDEDLTITETDTQLKKITISFGWDALYGSTQKSIQLETLATSAIQ